MNLHDAIARDQLHTWLNRWRSYRLARFKYLRRNGGLLDRVHDAVYFWNGEWVRG